MQIPTINSTFELQWKIIILVRKPLPCLQIIMVWCYMKMIFKRVMCSTAGGSKHYICLLGNLLKLLCVQ